MTNSTAKGDSKLTQSLRRAKNQTTAESKTEETKTTAAKKVVKKVVRKSAPSPKKEEVKQPEPIIVSERVWPD